MDDPVIGLRKQKRKNWEAADHPFEVAPTLPTVTQVLYLADSCSTARSEYKLFFLGDIAEGREGDPAMDGRPTPRSLAAHDATTQMHATGRD